jgi:ABC-2 type transport system permease protein
MSASATVQAIVWRDLTRSFRQKSRIVGGLARPFMWLLLVGTGYNAIARVEGAVSYQAYVMPGLIVMSALFGSMLTSISTVYDREFGMLRLMLAAPAGVPAVLVGRAIAATIVGVIQGSVVLAFAPLFMPVTATQAALAMAALALAALVSSMLGLMVAAPIRSLENFAGIINVVLFPMLFLSGALYPTAGMPPALRVLAHVNPVSYAVDLTRRALGQPAEFGTARAVAVLIAWGAVAFVLAAVLFDPESRLKGKDAGPGRRPAAA